MFDAWSAFHNVYCAWWNQVVIRTELVFLWIPCATRIIRFACSVTINTVMSDLKKRGHGHSKVSSCSMCQQEARLAESRSRDRMSFLFSQQALRAAACSGSPGHLPTASSCLPVQAKYLDFCPVAGFLVPLPSWILACRAAFRSGSSDCQTRTDTQLGSWAELASSLRQQALPHPVAKKRQSACPARCRPSWAAVGDRAWRLLEL